MSFKKPPLTESNQKALNYSITQTLNNSSLSPMKQIRSRSLADISNNMKNNSLINNINLNESVGSNNLNEIGFLACKIQDIVRSTLQYEKDYSLEQAIEFEKLRKALKNKEDEIQAISYSKDQEINNLLSDLSSLDQRLGEFHNQNNQLLNENHALKKELEEAHFQANVSLQRFNEEHDQLVNELNKQAIIQEELKQEIDTWANKFAHLDRGHQSHIEEIRKQCDLDKRAFLDMEMLKIHQQFQQDIQQIQFSEQSKVGELEQLLKRIESERDQLFEENRMKEIDLEDMKHEIQTLQKIELDNRKMVAHIQFLEQKLESLVHDGQRTRQFTEEYRQKINQKERVLQEQLSRLQQERDQIEGIKCKLIKDLQAVQSENKSLVNEMHGMESELQQCRVQNEELQTNVKLLQEDLRNLQVYRQRYHELQTNSDKRDEMRFLQLQEQFNNLQLAYNQLKNNEPGQLKVMQGELSRKDQIVRELENKIRFYIDENSRLLNR